MPEAPVPDRLPQAPIVSRILRPGLPVKPGTQRYTIQGGGSTVVPISVGDEITVANLEGSQLAEIVAIDSKGKIDLGVIGTKSNGTATGIQSILGDDSSQSAKQARASLERRGVDLAKSPAIQLFDSSTPAGVSEKFKVQRDGLLVVAAPGEAMDAHGQNTLTPIELRIKKSVILTRNDIPLPEPLANPLQDIRVKSSSAESYFVKAGEYIQILDVAGQQCSDFQAFSARKLDKGIQHALDATTTRTVIGCSYPIPGLHSKMFDQETTPLLEIVQDTCGRHDAFLLACTNRYYDDMGYPGHVNCTDNFNYALTEYGVEDRAGWMALNFFYNTGIDEHNTVFLDEPLSKPGDYVMLRALTDLVCVSSACPDDIDPANGWDPTDIHVRTYSEIETFSKAVAFRMTPDADPIATRETGFHSSFAKHTRNFSEYNGFWLANHFSENGAIDEYWAARESAVIMDLSPLRKFEITGPDAEALMQYCVTRNVRKMAIGQVAYSAMCYDHGGMIDDGTVYKLGNDNFRWVCGSDLSGIWLREKAEELGMTAWVRSSTDQLHNVAVQGPKAIDFLNDIIWTPPTHSTVEELGVFRFTVGRIHGFHGAPVVVSRTGYTGERGYEVFCHPKHAETVFNAIWEAGVPHGLKPFGLEALDMVRIEAGLVFAGYEFCDQTDPFEAGIGFTVPLKSKEDDFVGRDALIRRKANPMRKLVGLEIHCNEVVAHGDCIHIGRPQIGEVTSGMRSPYLKKNIALARMDIAHAEIGTEVEIGKLDGHQKRLPATIVAFPHFDPTKSRVKGIYE